MPMIPPLQPPLDGFLSGGYGEDEQIREGLPFGFFAMQLIGSGIGDWDNDRFWCLAKTLA